MRYYYAGILFVFLTSSCDWPSGGKDGVSSIPVKSIPFICDGNYFIRMENRDLGHSFSIGNDQTSFYSVGKDKIYKYDLESLQLMSERSFLSGIDGSYYTPRNDQTGWLLTKSFTNNTSKWAVNLLDTTGNIITSKELDNPPNGYLMTSTPDNGFVLVAHPHSTIDNDKYSVSRYSDKGVLMWKKELIIRARISQILSLRAGGFLIGGYSYVLMQGGGTTYNSFLAKLDNDGKLLWKKENHLGDLNNQYSINSIVEDSSGDYFLLLRNWKRSLSLVKSDSSYAIQWSTVVDNQFSFSQANMNQVGNNIMVFYSAGNGTNGSFNIYLACISNSGNILWNRTFGGTGDETAHALFKAPSSGYCLIGSTRNWDGISQAGVSSAYLIKTDLEGNSCK